MSIVPEQWCPVVGYEGCYEVSNLGRVRSLPRVVIRSDGQKLTVRGGILKPILQACGYLTVRLSRAPEFQKKSLYVHALVATAFIGPRPDGLHVLHGEKGSLDNSANNLTYGTRSENLGRDRVRDGTIVRGSASNFSKLDEAAVLEIRARLAAGERQVALAAEFGVSARAVSAINTGSTWSWLAG